MTPAQKEAIETLRRQGLGYKKIAKYLQLSVNTIKSFCQRKRIPQGTPLQASRLETYCLACGAVLPHISGRKAKRFCSSPCRMSWWNRHLDLVERKAYTSHICQYCHAPFDSYGNPHRKYCSHACYISERFGGGKK